MVFSALLHLALSINDQGPVKLVHAPASLQKVIIIADPGVDDAAAILMAVSHPDLDVLAVISNFGIQLYRMNYSSLMAICSDTYINRSKHLTH